MKKLMILGILFSGLTAFAQPEGEKKVEEKTEVIIGKKKITIVQDTTGGGNKYEIANVEEVSDDDKKEKKRYSNVNPLAIDLGFNTLMYNNSFNLPDELSLYDTRFFNSANVGIHMLPTQISIVKGRMNLHTALTLDINQFAWDKNISVLPDTDMVVLVEDSINYRKSKLTSYYLQVPLMLNFQTNPDRPGRSFTFSVGGYAGVLAGGRTKQKTEDGDKIKNRDDFNLNKFRYGVTGRIGYGKLEFYVNYNLSELFREGRGPAFTPVTFGVSLMGFASAD